MTPMCFAAKVLVAGLINLETLPIALPPTGLPACLAPDLGDSTGDASASVVFFFLPTEYCFQPMRTSSANCNTS